MCIRDRGKGTWRDPAVRIPLIVRNPYSSHVGLRSDALVSLHDLTATFLDFAGCSQLDDMDSISLRPLLDGKCTEHREVLISEFRDWSLVFDGRYKLVLDSKKENLLFDLKTDPLEDHNIASKHPDIIAKLSKSAYSDNG